MARTSRLADLEALYRQRFLEFVRVAAAICGDEGQGADAVQDAFARAIRSLGSFRGDAPLEAWVWRIVVNIAQTSRMRDQRPEPQAELASNGRAPGSTNDDDVMGWLAALPDRQRAAIFLRYFADLDYKGIAVALDVEVGTVSATLSAAHKKLRDTMEVRHERH